MAGEHKPEWWPEERVLAEAEERFAIVAAMHDRLVDSEKQSVFFSLAHYPTIITQYPPAA